jgi:hypothetical protein
MSNNSSCTEHSASFDGVVAVEGQLAQASEVPQIEPYPMAMVLSQDAVNKLFAAVASAEIPDIVLEDNSLVPVKLTLSPALPLIQVGGEGLCVSCLLTEVGFGIGVEVAGVGASGAGAGRFQFPLFMDPQGLENTAVMAQFGQSTLLSVNLTVDGLSDSIMDVIEPMVANAVTGLIRNQYGDTKLFDIKAWEIGDGDVKLVGQGPHIDAGQRTIVIGMQSNLVRPTGASIAWNPSLPEGADVGLQFHPELISSMIGRMMHEGHIPRSYDAAGKTSVAGEHQVTLSSMSATDNDLLRSSFRLWRTGGGFCGFADLQADLGLSISDRQLSFQVQNVLVTDSAGAGDLLQLGSDWLGSDFLSNLINYSQLTVNYNELAIPGNKKADMSAESFRLSLDAQGLSLFLNIDAIIDADG